MSKQFKILWHSVKPTIPSGYGTQTALILPALKAAGYDVAVSSTTGSFCTVEGWNGIPVFPHSEFPHLYGADTVGSHAERWKADLVWSWLDVFALPPKVCKNTNWAAWTPADSDPIMERNLPALRACRWQVGPTQFGCRVMKEAGLKNIVYVPCAYDPKVFHPLNRAAARQQFSRIIKRDLGNKFLVNVVGTNISQRKNYPAVLDAWSRFSRKHRNVMLYIHAEAKGLMPGGTNLIKLAKLYGVSMSSILFVEQWHYRTGQIPGEYLNLLYNASDVHLNACYGEGFGLPIMDAQAAGCPTIVPDFAAAGEIGFGIKVAAGNKYPTVPGGFQFMVDHKELAFALEVALDHKGDPAWRSEMVERAQPYRLDRVMKDHFLPTLKRMEAEIKRSPR